LSSILALIEQRADFRRIEKFLLVDGRFQLAGDVARFVNQMPPPRSENKRFLTLSLRQIETPK
jgi:hypothetical protein